MNFAKNSLNTINTIIITSIAMMGVSVYVARVLGPDIKGAYSLLIQFASIVALFGMFGINNSIVFFLGKGEIVGDIYQNILSLSSITGLVLVCIFTIFFNFIQSFVLKGIAAFLIATIFISIPFMLVNKYSLGVILGLNQIKAFNRMKVVAVAILIFCLALFVPVLNLGVRGLIIGFVLSEIIMFTVFIMFFYKRCKIKFAFNPVLLKKMAKYGIRGFLAPLLLLLIYRIDFFLLNYFNSAQQVGYYSIAVIVAETAYLIPMAAGTILFPKLSSSATSVINEKTAQLIRALFFLLAIMVGCLYIFGQWLILFIYGRQYYPAINILKYLLPGYFLMSFYSIFFSYFSLINKQGVVTAVIFLILIIKALLSFKIIPVWGMAGAAAVSSASYALCGILLFVIFFKYSGAKLADVICIKMADIRHILKSLDKSHVR